MSKILQRILFMLCLFLLEPFSSFAQEKNKSAQEYINTITITLDSLTATAQNFAGYLEIVIPIAEHEPDFKLAKNKIDSLKSYYNIYINCLVAGISKFSKLKEFDTSIKIVTPCIHFFKKTKTAYSSTFPSYFRIYHIGWSKASNSDKLIMRKSPKILREANLSSWKELKNLGSIIDEFNRKYALTSNLYFHILLFTAANMGLPQAALDKLTLAFYRYQSWAMDLTV